MEIVRRLYLRSWRGLALAASLALIAYLLYFHRLGSLLPGYSQPELGAFKAAGNWHNIVNDPINAPYKLVVWLFAAMGRHSLVTTRAVAAGYGVIAGLLFFAAVRSWCAYRTAFLATVMFTASAGLLHVARLGTGDILQMGNLALLDVALWYRAKRRHRTLLAYTVVALFALLCYVPGIVWFELLGAIVLRGTVRGQLRRAKTPHLASLLVLFLVLLAPLARAAASSPRLLLRLAGLPYRLSLLSHFGSSILHTLLSIFIHSNGSPLFWVGHAPLLDAVEVALGLLGAYYVYREATGRRTFLYGSAIIGLVLVALGGSVTIACLIPVAYLFIAVGLDNLLGQWLVVFPRNPIARLAGIGLVCLMLLFSVLYQVRTYYVAWPHAPATRQVFSHTRS